jgi:hypothetical protein
MLKFAQGLNFNLAHSVCGDSEELSYLCKRIRGAITPNSVPQLDNLPFSETKRIENAIHSTRKLIAFGGFIAVHDRRSRYFSHVYVAHSLLVEFSLTQSRYLAKLVEAM